MITMVTIGTIYRQDCPIEDYVPVYLIMSGVVSMMILSWIVIVQVDMRYVSQMDIYVKMKKVQWFLGSLLLIWCGCGCWFVFSIAFPSFAECNPVVYHMSFIVVVGQLLIFFNLCAYSVFSCFNCFKRSGEQPELVPAPQPAPAQYQMV